MRVVCIGDSITEGQYLWPGLRWTTLLQERRPRDEIVNAGISNETTRQALERFPRDVQEQRPDIVLIQFGANDANYWKSDNGLPRVSLSAFDANLVEMIQRSLAAGASRAALLTITGSVGQPKLYQDNVALYNEIIRAHFPDVIEASWAPLREDFLPDGLHLSPRGHRLYADIVDKALG